jgi:ATP-dependent Clp protease ATP-binding subunit ClpC
MASGLKGLLAQAERLARKRAQPPSTAHLLLALYQRTPVGVLLGQHGVTEGALLAAVALDCDEHQNALAFALERADKSAVALGHARASSLHLLLVLTREARSVAYRCLERLGVSPQVLQSAVLAALHGDAPRAQAQSNARSASSPARSVAGATAARSRRAPTALSAQQRLAVETEQRRTRERQTRDPGAESAPPAERLELSPEPARRGARGVTEPASRRAPAQPVASEPFVLDPARFPLLASLGRDLCAEAAQGRIDPVLGREAEIEQVLDVLARRRANNPILVGPPGVGKTALALGVARLLSRGQARGLSGRVLIELSASALLSGTGVRGALSERLQGLTQEIARAAGRVIVFIDEIHGVVGADDGADSMANGLKAALARGELPCIGATTEAEYRRVFERDAALARRFTRIDVGEPSPEAALAILRGLAPEYEQHHGVAYEPAALQSAVELSVRFMSERHLPDKAIAVIDQAAARVRRRGGAEVDLRAVAEVISEHCAVPIERLLMRDGEALLALEAHLERRVVGQRDAIAAIADALRKGAAGFRGSRPLGTFLLLGPTGVGKTEMAKAIAEVLFPGTEPTRLDMSELSEPHAVARLIGSPPGYVGHEDGGQLTEAVRARPYQLVLLDEIEKAHREVLLALLPLLDEGRLTDGRGRTVDFTNTVIVMTSNLGVEVAAERGRVGFGASQILDGDGADARMQRTLAAARQALPPELWNRIDEPLYFPALDRATVRTIAMRMCAGVAALMRAQHGIEVEIVPSAIDALIAAGGYDPALGARPMRRTIGRLLEARLARALLSAEFTRGDAVVVRGMNDQIVLERRIAAVDAAE